MLSITLFLLVIFSSRIRNLSEKLHPNDIPCSTCNGKISRDKVDNNKVVCPSCNEQLVRNNKKLTYLIMAIVVLGLSLFIGEKLKPYLQVTYILFMFIWSATNEFIESNV